MSETRIRGYRQALARVFERPLGRRDGIPDLRLRRTEERLGFALPGAMRDFYRVAGAARENRAHNRLFEPEDLMVEQGYLLFMEENQAVVHWGVPLPILKRPDPEVWQRVNGEEMPFSVFVVRNLAWQRGAHA